MKLLILKDNLITDAQLAALMSELSALYQKHAGISPTYKTEPRDYTAYPIVIDSDGDGRLPDAYIRGITQDIHRRYSGEGTDHVIFLIHRKNWRLKGIWGVNYSTMYNGYQVQVARFDDTSTINSLGTLYHEIMHSHDALIHTMLGFNINTLFKNVACYQDWDNTVVHGNRFKGCATRYKYIKWNDNTDALTMIAPYLRDAYAKRHAIFEQKRRTMLEQIQRLSQQVAMLIREVTRRKVKYK